MICTGVTIHSERSIRGADTIADTIADNFADDFADGFAYDFADCGSYKFVGDHSVSSHAGAKPAAENCGSRIRCTLVRTPVHCSSCERGCGSRGSSLGYRQGILLLSRR